MAHTLPHAQLTHQAHARGGPDTNTKSPKKSVHEGIKALPRGRGIEHRPSGRLASAPAACPSCATAKAMSMKAGAKSKGSTNSAGVTIPAELAEPQPPRNAPRTGLHERSDRRMKVYRLNSPPQAISLTRT